MNKKGVGDIKVVQNKNRILIVDDHPVVRQGLMQLINYEPDLVVCAMAENTSQALNFIEKQPIDLAVVDISLNGENGLELTEKIKTKWPTLPVLILSLHNESHCVKSAFEVGASGYVTKDEATKKIIKAIRHVLGGEIYISKKAMENIPNKNIYKIFTEIDRDSG